MKPQDEIVFLDLSRRLRNGFFLGCSGDQERLVWAIVPELGFVYEFNEINVNEAVEQTNGRPWFSVYDRQRPVQELERPGDAFFPATQLGESMLRLAKSYGLLIQ